MMKDITFSRTISRVIYLAAAICIVLALSGCYTRKIATNQVVKAQAKYPDVVAGLCGNFYDPVEWIRDSIVYKQGETIFSHDTVELDCDTVRVEGKSRVVKVPCPPCKDRVDTFYVNKTQVQVNRAKEQAQEAEIKTLQTKLTTTITHKSWFMWLFMIVLGYTLLRWVLKYGFKINILP